MLEEELLEEELLEEELLEDELLDEELLEDVNGDQVDDLVLREGGKVSLFKGTTDGMDFDKPLQVLRSGGNVLSTFLYDENEDGLKQLTGRGG